MYHPTTDPLLSDVTTSRADAETRQLHAGERLLTIDPSTGEEYVIAVEAVREVDGREQITGRVVSPRRARGNIVTMTTLA